MLKFLPLLLLLPRLAFGQESVAISGRVTDPGGATVSGAIVEATDPVGRIVEKTTTDADGRYELYLKAGSPYALVIRSDSFQPEAAPIRSIDAPIEDWNLQFGKLQNASDVIDVTEHIIEPSVERRDAEIFNKALFSRDDQIFQTLGAGLNFGQHAGGGKSLEVRRFGFNLDHGGAGGGLRFMRDGVFINDIAGGHAHGYLGSLKGLTPELVAGVDLINGPFNAQYGDFSALGVVTIDTRQKLDEDFMGRIQYGQFNTRRFVGAYSPEWGKNTALFAFENSYTDGPFQRALEYNRNNITAVFNRTLNATDKFTLRAWGATSKSFSPGQLPLDAVEDGRISRYGFIDPTEGNDEQSGTLAAYWDRETATGTKWKANAVINRALFDLYSNFTFFLDHPDLPQGDAIVQHSSRLQQQGNLLYQKPHVFGSGFVFGTFNAGGNLIANQANLVLAGRSGRSPTDLRTAANIAITNPGTYAQESLVMAGGKVRVDLGLRYDIYTMAIRDRMNTGESRSQTQGYWQPKAAVAYTPKLGAPLTLHANYGRSNTSADVRSLLQLNLPTLGATTDFYQVGTSHNKGRFSASTSLFLIERSNEFVYVSDSGLTELGGPSRSTGFEVKSSFNLTRTLSINGSISKVANSYYKDTEPREYVIRAPHFTAYSALTLSDWHGWSGSLRFRAISHYTLTGVNAVTAPGYSVWDFSVAKPINRWIDLNFSMDNLFNKSYYETMALYESRLQGEDPVERIHATTGYPRTVTGGVTIHLFPKR
jgi:outer membrane receptor protein involved in Fe transport